MRLAMLSGGVGGARLARGLAAITDVGLSVIVNVGDDERIYGLLVSLTLTRSSTRWRGREGPNGWGLRDDPFTVNGVDGRTPHRHPFPFRIGDRDIATNLFRTDRLAGGWSSPGCHRLASAFGVPATVLPATTIT